MKWAKYILSTKLTRIENRVKQTLQLTERIQRERGSHAPGLTFARGRKQVRAGRAGMAGGERGQSRGSGEPPASLCFPVAPFSLSDAGSGASGAGPASRHAQGQRPPQPHSVALPEASGLADD